MYICMKKRTLCRCYDMMCNSFHIVEATLSIWDASFKIPINDCFARRYDLTLHQRTWTKINTLGAVPATSSMLYC